MQGSLFGSMIYRQASRSALGRQLHAFAQIPANTGAFSGLIKNPETDTHLRSSILGFASSFRSCIHSGEQTEVLAQERRNGVNQQPPPVESGVGSNLRSMGSHPVLNRENRIRVNTRESTPVNMDYVQMLRGSGVIGGAPLHQQQESTPMNMDYVQMLRGSGVIRGAPLHQQQLESNADIVHIKLMRNNSYVTLTDDKGNRKMSVSAGQVAAKGDKPGRYSGEAAAEYMGRVVKQMKIRSVVVKVSGFTYFRRKKDAILAFKDGYTHSRGDVNPVVYIEDTTRKPHNGCRLPKSRRI